MSSSHGQGWVVPEVGEGLAVLGWSLRWGEGLAVVSLQTKDWSLPDYCLARPRMTQTTASSV